MTKIRRLGTSVLVSLVVLASLMFNVSPVFAETYQNVHVLVAYDEELEHTANWRYWYSPEVFCEIIIDEVSDRFKTAFGIKFTIIHYVFWDSNDSITEDIDAFEREVISETGFYTGMTYNTILIDILIAFSDQTVTYQGDPVGGKANSTLGTTIVFESYHLLSCTQYTDNILQHELTHLYENPGENFHHWIAPELPGYDCVMNIYPIYIGFPEYIWRPYGITTENWCDDCRAILNDRKAKWGREQTIGAGHCPTLFVWNGTGYVDYGVINIHNSFGEDMVKEVPIQGGDISVNHYKVEFKLREGWLGLTFSESFIDQVKLYALDDDGNRYLCPLTEATHSDKGNVLVQLSMSDDYRIRTILLETINLTFIMPYRNIQRFVFVIEGCNAYKVP